MLIAVLLFTSVLLFIAGFFCGHFSRQQKPAANETSEEAGQSPPLNVLYEEVVTRQEVTVELKQNEAYGPLRPQ